MTLVMDGVRRVPGGAGAAASQGAPAQSSERPQRPSAKPISAATSRANSGVRYVTGMDGVRRPVPAPRPQAAPLPKRRAVVRRATAPQPTAPAYSGWRQRPRRRWRRSVVGFALVATALMASGLAVRAVATPRTTTAEAEAARPAATVAPVAPSASPAVPKTGLQDLVNQFSRSTPDKFGIVVKDLKSGETATFAADNQMESASLYKLFVAKGIFQRIDIGKLTHTAPAGGGTGRTIDGCLTVMINISDNDCGRALGTILGWAAQNQGLGLEGYKQTDMATPQQTSATDVAQLLERLYKGTLVSANSGAQFLALLKDQRVNNRLPVGLPAGTVIAHKTGDLDGYVHDAGIVYGPKTDYLVVVTSGPWSAPAAAPAQFANFSGQLWSYFEQ